MYKEVCFNRGTEAEGRGELMWATRSAPLPPSHFMPASGLDLKIGQNMVNIH